MYDLVIFDLDGTLVNTLDDLADSCNEVLSVMGYPVHSTAAYRYFVGNGLAKLAERALPEDHRTDEDIRRFCEGFDIAYGRLYNNKSRPYDGMTGLVSDLARAGIKTAVASNKPDAFTKKIISEMFGDVFSLVRGNLPPVPKKPDPAILLSIMKELAVPCDRVLMVGDSGVDIQTAANAGTDSAGCTWGFRPREEFEENGAGYIADSPEELYSIITR
ncbi:MAG: HAD-IA family hydrolase [Oscillospiraceae bacterium]|nr:HAD-IA family hydrolase [Oscillospiraceae bacterium]